MSSQLDNPSDGGAGGASILNGVILVPVPTTLESQSTLTQAPEPSSTPSDQFSEPETSTEMSTPTSAYNPSVSSESTSSLGSNAAQATNVTQATQIVTVESAPGSDQLLTLNSAVALQIVGKY